MPARRVLILYNEPVLPPGHADAEAEREVLDTVEAVARDLADAGHAISRLGVSRDPAVLINGLEKIRPDVVFNLFEGTAEQSSSEAYVAGILEWLRVPFTGCPSQSMVLARDKPLAKHLFLGAGLPTADFRVIEQLPVSDLPSAWPVIVKPAREDASVGLDHKSVVTDQGQLAERVAFLLGKYGPPVLVEQYIPGREFNVGILESPDLQVLPIAEIAFAAERAGTWPIVTYEAKWAPGSSDDIATPPRCPADVSPDLKDLLGDLARRAFRLLGCRDYARVDFRVNPEGKPFILEVNPNPDFNPSAGLSGAIVAAGLTHSQVTLQFVDNALARTRISSRR
jgi:D-alanine-D-alanine ligase